MTLGKGVEGAAEGDSELGVVEGNELGKGVVGIPEGKTEG